MHNIQSNVGDMQAMQARLAVVAIGIKDEWLDDGVEVLVESTALELVTEASAHAARTRADRAAALVREHGRAGEDLGRVTNHTGA